MMLKFVNEDDRQCVWGMLFGLFLGLYSMSGDIQAQSLTEVRADAGQVDPQSRIVATTLDTLDSFVDLRNAMLQDIKAINTQIGASKSDAEKQKLKLQLDKLELDLRAVTRNFERLFMDSMVMSK